jgi:hypothetical protein
VDGIRLGSLNTFLILLATLLGKLDNIPILQVRTVRNEDQMTCPGPDSPARATHLSSPASSLLNKYSGEIKAQTPEIPYARSGHLSLNTKIKRQGE